MNPKEAIPFLDLVTPHVELEQELTEVFRRALHTASFIGGPLVEQFERGFADFCGVNYCVGASNGTDALRFALTAAGVKAATSRLPCQTLSSRPWKRSHRPEPKPDSWMSTNGRTTWTRLRCGSTWRSRARSTDKGGGDL